MRSIRPKLLLIGFLFTPLSPSHVSSTTEVVPSGLGALTEINP